MQIFFQDWFVISSQGRTTFIAKYNINGDNFALKRNLNNKLRQYIKSSSICESFLYLLSQIHELAAIVMTHLQSINKKFDKCCFTLSKEDITELDKADNGPINNVISGINKHCYGARLYDDKYGLTVEMFYVNSDKALKGDIIRLDLNDEDYFQLLFRFCVLLSNDYIEVDTIDAFNTFQTKLRGFLEKSGFFTTTTEELKQFEGKSAVMMAFSQRGIFNLKLIDKVDFLRDFFHNNFDSKIDLSSEYVYLMVNTDTSLIKIGTSKNPKYREKTLHSQEPKVHLVAKWNCSKELEKKLHQTYKEKRIRGEWFRLDLNDLKEIETFMKNEANNNSR